MSNPTQKPRNNPPNNTPDRDKTPRPERDMPDEQRREYGGGGTPSRERGYEDQGTDRGTEKDSGVERERDRNSGTERERDEA